MKTNSQNNKRSPRNTGTPLPPSLQQEALRGPNAKNMRWDSIAVPVKKFFAKNKKSRFALSNRLRKTLVSYRSRLEARAQLTGERTVICMVECIDYLLIESDRIGGQDV